MFRWYLDEIRRAGKNGFKQTTEKAGELSDLAFLDFKNKMHVINSL
jgi:hypothetical protein